MEESTSLSIGEIAARAGVNASSIRYYESIGLMPEAERVSGQRRYGPDAAQRLATIGIAQQAGFSLAEIGELLAESGRPPSERLQALARGKVADIEELISRAEAMKGWLEAASRCECETFDICALFEGEASRASAKPR
jgi:MerR family redox-sensitive transcriptional activator SoxR